MTLERIAHEFAPVYDKHSQILILGSFPSVKSRENQFYYGHPQNRFWKVLARIMEKEVPTTIEEKKNFLLDSHIAIWDVIASCRIEGSSDSSIRDVEVSDFSKILSEAPIKAIFVNGNKAYELYKKYAEEKTGIKAIRLPSTSPANAAWNLERLCQSWQIIKEKLTDFDEVHC